MFIGSSPYLRFTHKGIGYYSEVAHACDSVLQQHQGLASNEEPGDTQFGDGIAIYAEVSGSDASLPKIIGALPYPSEILVSSNRVFIEIPPECMGGFAVIWERDETRTQF